MKKWKPRLPKQWKWTVSSRDGRFRHSVHDCMTLHVIKEQFDTWKAILWFPGSFGFVTTCKAKVEGFPSCRAAIRAVETALLSGGLVQPCADPSPRQEVG